MAIGRFCMASAWHQRRGATLELTEHGERELRARYDRVTVGDDHDKERLEDGERVVFDTLLAGVVEFRVLPYPVAIGGIFLYVRHLYERVLGQAKTATVVNEYQDAINVYVLYRTMLWMAVKRREATTSANDPTFLADARRSIDTAYKRHLTRYGDALMAEREFDVLRGGVVTRADLATRASSLTLLTRYQQISFELLTRQLRSYEMALATLLDLDPTKRELTPTTPPPAVDGATLRSCLVEMRKIIERFNASTDKPEDRFSVIAAEGVVIEAPLLLPAVFLRECLWRDVK